MEYLVSIGMSTFEHGSYLGQAARSVMMQRTNFPFQLVIGEDRSTDDTREVCEMLSNEYGDRIKLLPSDRRYGQNQNFCRIVMACTGKYIALCEGDDYWTDLDKLQKQVDFLESNPDYVMCFHRINTVDANGTTLQENTAGRKINHYQGLDFFHIFIPTLAIMFRNCLRQFPPEFFCVKSTDAFLFGMLSGYGKGAELEFVGGSYRKHAGGLYNRLSRFGKFRQAVHTRRLMRRSSFFINEQKSAISRELTNRIVLYSKTFLKSGQFLLFARFLLFAFAPLDAEEILDISGIGSQDFKQH